MDGFSQQLQFNIIVGSLLLQLIALVARLQLQATIVCCH